MEETGSQMNTQIHVSDARVRIRGSGVTAAPDLPEARPPGAIGAGLPQVPGGRARQGPELCPGDEGLPLRLRALGVISGALNRGEVPADAVWESPGLRARVRESSPQTFWRVLSMMLSVTDRCHLQPLWSGEPARAGGQSWWMN